MSNAFFILTSFKITDVGPEAATEGVLYKRCSNVRKIHGKAPVPLSLF